MNLSFNLGIFPNNLKLNKINPIHKNGDVRNLNNYRPVALSSTFSKIFEYAFLSRLENFLFKFNIISPNQFGFRANSTTGDAIQFSLENIMKYLEKGEKPIGIFCDLTKAFDCVNHDILRHKLSNYGVRGTSLNWISSYLLDREQYVTIKHHNNDLVQDFNSERIIINVGVPQGGVLSPTLFLLYINDLSSIFTGECSITMYADDTSMIISDPDTDNLIDKCQNCLNRLSDWFCRNDLFFNKSKTHYLRFHNQQYKNDLDVDIFIDDHKVSRIYKTKFLGSLIDENFIWKAQVEHIAAKLSTICFQLRHLNNILTEQQLILFYHAKAEPLLRYGICFWGTSSAVSDVFICQKRIIRNIAKCTRTSSCKTLFKKYNIFTITCLYIFEVSKFIYKNKSSFVLNSSYHSFNTRQKDNFCIPLTKYNVTKNAPHIQGLRIFNNLPSEIKSCRNVKQFLSGLKTFLLKHCFYNIQEFYDLKP